MFEHRTRRDFGRHCYEIEIELSLFGKYLSDNLYNLHCVRIKTQKAFICQRINNYGCRSQSKKESVRIPQLVRERERERERESVCVFVMIMLTPASGKPIVWLRR